MKTVLERIDAELVDESAQFFAPVSSDLLDGLLGQYQATRKRIEAAASLVKPGGILVAILPSGHATRLTLAGFDCEYTQPIDNAFPGVGVSVVILKAVKHGETNE